MGRNRWCFVGIVLALTLLGGCQGVREADGPGGRAPTAPDKQPAPPKAPAPAADPVVGKWAWFNGGTVSILPDGTLTHEQGNRGTWTVQDRARRVYVLRWRQGDFVDTVTLSEDGQSLSGTNQGGAAVSARRTPEGPAARPEPRPPSPPPGQPADQPGATPVTLKTTEKSLGKRENQTPSPPVLSPDDRHQLDQTWRDGKIFVAQDGVEGKNAYDVVDHLTFSPDSKHTAFLATRGGKLRAVVDGVEGPEANRVEELQFSPDGKRVGYILFWEMAGSGVQTYRAVIDGAAGPAYRSVRDLAFSPDGKHVAYVAERAGTAPRTRVETVVVLDGKEGKGYDGIAQGSLRFKPDSDRPAFLARRDSRLVAVIDDVEGQEAAEFSFSPDGKRVAYVLRRDTGTAVLVDGRQRPMYGGNVTQLTFSPDGKHLAYMVNQFSPVQQFAVVDGREGSPSEAVSEFQFGADGRFAYLARRGFEEVCVTDAGPGAVYIQVGDIHFSPDGKHLAYRGLRRDGVFVVVRDGKEEKGYRQIVDRSVRFSPDGKHLAYRVMLPGGMTVVADGVEGKGYNFNGSVPGLAFSPDGKHLAYVAVRQDGGGVVVVDGAEGPPFDRVLEVPVVFDDPNRFHVLGIRGPNLVRLDVEIGE
jgi:Tol biopolymer transport system component